MDDGKLVVEVEEQKQERRCGCCSQASALVRLLGGYARQHCTNGPRLRKRWRSGINVYVCSFCTHLYTCGSVAAGQLYTKYRAGGGEGVWPRIRLRIGLHTLGYREWTMGLD